MLIAIGSKAVAPMMAAWQRDAENYRFKLGIVIVLNQMLRNKPDMESEVSKKLNGDDIRLLVNAAIDLNKTTRDQAAEFLYALKDKRVVPAGISALSHADGNGAFYIVLIDEY